MKQRDMSTTKTSEIEIVLYQDQLSMFKQLEIKSLY